MMMFQGMHRIRIIAHRCPKTANLLHYLVKYYQYWTAERMGRVDEFDKYINTSYLTYVRMKWRIGKIIEIKKTPYPHMIRYKL